MGVASEVLGENKIAIAAVMLFLKVDHSWMLRIMDEKSILMMKGL